MPATAEFTRSVDLTGANYAEKSIPISTAWPGASAGVQSSAIATRAAALAGAESMGVKILN